MSSHRRVPESRSHRAPRKPRARIALTGAAALAVVSGGTAFACMGHPAHHSSGTSPQHVALPAGWHPSDPQPTHHAHTHPAKPHPPRPTSSPAPRPTTTATPAPAPTASSSPTKPAPTPSHSAPPTSAPTAAPTASPTAPAADSAVQQVLDLINKARAQQGLPAYRLLDGLNNSAAQHNQVMAGGCGLSHQCPGEPAFGDRETANGVHWSSAGENVGVGGPVANTPQAIAAMAVNLTQSMLDETAPNDGHRRNILSSGFTYVGIAIQRDSSGSVWLTQDFAALR